jgi:hypothetical protein
MNEFLKTVEDHGGDLHGDPVERAGMRIAKLLGDLRPGVKILLPGPGSSDRACIKEPGEFVRTVLDENVVVRQRVVRRE